MKIKFLLAAICLLFTINSQANSPTDKSNSVFTGDTLVVSGHSFPIMQSNEGEKYIQCKKLNGKPYEIPVWENTGDKFEGRDVYKYKNNGYFYYGLSKHGFPCYVWLIKERRRQ
jgi:hypothetical protein